MKTQMSAAQRHKPQVTLKATSRHGGYFGDLATCQGLAVYALQQLVRAVGPARGEDIQRMGRKKFSRRQPKGQSGCTNADYHKANG